MTTMGCDKLDRQRIIITLFDLNKTQRKLKKLENVIDDYLQYCPSHTSQKKSPLQRKYCKKL